MLFRSEFVLEAKRGMRLMAGSDSSRDNEPSIDEGVTRKPIGWGPAFCALAAVLWSTSALFARAPQFEAWPVETRGANLAFWRAIFALVILVPMIRQITWDKRLIPLTLLFALMNWTYLTALVGGPPANAIWLQNLAPAWVMLAVVFWFREPKIGRAHV